jgi:hypothetical protein
MEAEFKNQLPPQLWPLVDRIEASAGVEITVIQDPSLKRAAEARPLMVDGVFKPTIVFRGDLSVTSGIYPQPYSIACHELLHLERYFVEWVPWMQIRGLRVVHAETGQVLVEDGEQVGEFGDLDLFEITNAHIENVIEHVAIEPRQAQYGFSPRHGEQAWRFWLDPKYTPLLKRRVLLLEWLNTDLLTDDELIKGLARPLLKREGLLDDALALSYYMRNAIATSKEAMAMVIGTFLELHPDHVRLVYLRSDRPGMVSFRFLPEKMTIPTTDGKEIRISLIPA